MLSKEEIYDKIKQLEKEEIEYLEVDNKPGARRKRKQIERLEIQLELFNLNKIKEELKIYKEVVKEYPVLQMMIKNRLYEARSNESKSI